MNPIAPDQLLAQLRWRYAVKRFDPTRRIPEETWEALEQALILTPSSYGLQPWRFIAVTNPEVKAALLPAAYNQKQVVDCSHLLVIAALRKVGPGDIDRHLDAVERIQGRPRESLEGYRNVMIRDIVDGPRGQDATGWAKLQCYIALGNFMTAAALVGIDACPMEGFIPAKVDQVLGLEPRGLTAAVLCPAGYRSAEDKYATAPKVRFDRAQVVERV